MKSFLKDVQHGIRLFRKTPGLTATAIIMLALGIGSNTAVFSVVYGILLMPLGYPEEERLVHICGAKPSQESYHAPISVPDFLDWRQQTTSFSDIGAYGYASHTLAGAEHPERVEVVRATPGVLSILGFGARLGRAFNPEEVQRGKSHLAMLSDTFWRRTFGADPGIIGQPIILDDISFTVLGILPPELDEAWGQSEIWIPLAFDSSDYDRVRRWYRAVARLKPGVSITDAQAEMEVIAARLADTYPDSNAGWTVKVLPINRWVVRDATRVTLCAVMLVVVFVLLIACANVAHLLLAKASVRHKEFGIRSALGATRGRLLRQAIAECAILGLGGGALGILLAVWLVECLVMLLPSNLRGRDGIALDWHVLLFTVVVSLTAAVLSGLMPALWNSRGDPSCALKDGTRAASAGPGRQLSHDLLVIAQLSIAMMLVTCAGLVTKSVLALQSVDPGFDARRVLTMRIALPALKYDNGEKRTRFFEQVTQRVRRIPGVESAAAVCSPPLAGQANVAPGVVEDHIEPTPHSAIDFGYVVVTPGYFEAMRMPILKGRDFTGQDTGDSQQVAIVNRSVARRFWPAEDPIGKRIKYGARNSENPWVTIVGIVGDVKRETLKGEVRLETYRPHSQAPRSTMTVVARVVAHLTTATAAVRDAIWEVDPSLAVYWVRPMEDIVARRISGAVVVAVLLGAFAVIGLVMAVLGLYCLVSYGVSLRRREIGIRVALGAQSPDVLRLVLMRSMFVTIVGVLGGVGLALALGGALGTLMYGVSPTDPTTFVGMGFLMVVVAGFAGYLPARRATKVDPIVALRYE